MYIYVCNDLLFGFVNWNNYLLAHCISLHVSSLKLTCACKLIGLELIGLQLRRPNTSFQQRVLLFYLLFISGNRDILKVYLCLYSSRFL